MPEKGTQLLLYFKLLARSRGRLFMEFPWVLRLLFVFLFGGGVYLLANLPFSPSVRNFAIVFVAFFLLGQLFCRLSPQEKVLLTFLKIPVLWIRVIKCLFISVFFFLVDVWVGLLAAIPGTFAVAFYSGGTSRNVRILSFYVPASYQWLGMFRRSGIWVLSAGMLLLLIALWHRNTNMVCFCLGWIICLPAFLTYFGQPDVKKFMSVYTSSRLLLRMKIREFLLNSSIPLVLCVALIFLFDFANAGLYLRFILFFLYADLLLFYFSYICYPHILTALVSCAFFVYISAGFFFSYPLITVLAGCLFWVLLHWFAVINLKSIISNGKAESTN